MGQCVATFEPVEQKYRGGQGEVWLGVRDDGLPVAIKYMHDNPASLDPAADRKRFAREVRCQTTLQHPNIVPIVASDTSASPPFYVMPWAERSLRQELSDAGGPMAQQVAVDVIRDVLSAVMFAHDEGVLHRDLKPENILRLDGRWCVSDFGLSRLLDSDSTTLTLTNAALGTVAYSAPEQFRNAHEADARADVYALGKILYEMLTGEMPFPSMDLSKVPPRFRHVIARSVSEGPSHRYDSVAELLRQIETLVEAPASLEPPLLRAQTLLDSASSDTTALAEIARILTENDADDVLYTKFVPYIPVEIVAALYAHHRSEFVAALHKFDEYVSGGLPFSYTDTVASFLEDIFEVCGEDERLRLLVLRRVLLMGWDHNRFYVGQTFARLVAAREDPSHVLMIAELLRAEPAAAGFVGAYFVGSSLPEAIRKALP